MVAVRSDNVLAVLLSDAGVECDPAQPEAEESLSTEAGQELCPELDGERDLGSVDLPDEYGSWQDDYADAVGISRWREL